MASPKYTIVRVPMKSTRGRNVGVSEGKENCPRLSGLVQVQCSAMREFAATVFSWQRILEH